MRVIVYGVGAIGGAVAAALCDNGVGVVGIARGRMLEAIRERGLHLRSPVHDKVHRFECVAKPAEISFRGDDLILMCMKTQDTLPALEALRAAGVTTQAIFCLQNGVANERMALRLFPNVHGVTVMLPGSYLDPGEVAAFCEPKFGLFDIGRFPNGTDAHDKRLAKAFDGSMIAPFLHEDVMASKYGKLVLNLQNGLTAAFGKDAELDDLYQAAKTEAVAALEAHGITWQDVSASADPRRDDLMRMGKIEGLKTVGGSTAQSLARGGSVEIDYLSGEISLLGRLAGITTPVNDAVTALVAEMAREGRAPGSADPEVIRRMLAG
ncbi:ketopantoate reductase family protein [Lutimaribacter sp. EGI FJ00015]|uniref:Ketopantoate reductase family protein n=1 Tax=Lutimaribacter degradans TaxID=2945989 RepID=A0ACC5ZUP4_9RHOB|nr:2-dehydropantoate 2-reductase N-terminal domain-containing protein [Lutimaribacter sp. EGI FJ00013]MCM2562069.1 ketopantoate reductase family protein [Lutimaribacter sp. EGI FJ00013]MCO0615064.1 ketopantoate reductase family protein [Lutimaribacter sp. EGI FJ00015]MCO0635901.1 ketopantoate reductase family protein [Lutimaribacter sp. EGI FJ00014]